MVLFVTCRLEGRVLVEEPMKYTFWTLSNGDPNRRAMETIEDRCDVEPDVDFALPFFLVFDQAPLTDVLD